MADTWLWFDGDWQPENELTLSENRAFLFGDGFFETIRVSFNREVLLKKFHWARIRRTVDALHFPWPPHLNENAFWSLIFSRLPQKMETDIRLKVVFFRKGKGNYTPEGAQAAFFVSIAPLDYPWIRFGKPPGRCESLTLPLHPFSWIKSTSALIYSMAGMECRSRGLEDLVLCTAEGFVVEGTYSSLFWLSGDVVQIPDPALGGLHSCMKEFLLEFWNKNQIRVEKKSLDFEGLMQADWLGMANGTGIKIDELSKGFDGQWLPEFEQELSGKR